MCGFAGIVAGRRRIDGDALRAMTAALAARGPDGEGFHVTAQVGLGHRRLAVIDVAGGAQPLFGARGKVAAVVNGEIYNHVALRAELEALGHRFVTRCDAEVVVHGYVAWGRGVAARLDGQFAFAVWDGNLQQVLLVRDRMGEKPLYWAHLADGTLVFASTLAALRCHPEVSRAVDPAALARYLVAEYVPSPRAILRGVRKLAPGELVEMTVGRPPQVAIWWNPPVGVTALSDEPDAASQGAAPAPRALPELAAALRDTARAAVTRQLVAEVPLGVFLSGGLDSSFVAALAAEARGRVLDTFSVGFDDPSHDESAHARAVAAAIGSRHHERIVTAADALALVPRLAALTDEPLGDPSILPTHLLARFARERVTVALGGDGGDELFGGYPTFAVEALAGRVLDLVPARALGLAGRGLAAAVRGTTALTGAGAAYFSFDFRLAQLARGLGERGARRHQAWLAAFLPREVEGLLARGVRDAAAGDLYDHVGERVARCRTAAPADRLFCAYGLGYLADGVLQKVDRASMAVGLEVRAPLLDHAVIRLACSLPPDLRLGGTAGKPVLREAARGLVPDAIRLRRKHGFAIPVSAWLRGPLAGWMRDLLSPAALRTQGLFDPRAVERLVAGHLGGRVDHRKRLWTLLAFQSWARGLNP